MQKQDSKDIKLFGLALVILLSLLSIKLSASGNLFYRKTAAIAVIFFALAIFLPKMISPIHKIFKLFGLIVSSLVTNIVLILIFYLLFTPIGLILKIMGKDLLSLERTNGASYWVRKEEVFLKDRYFRQF